LSFVLWSTVLAGCLWEGFAPLPGSATAALLGVCGRGSRAQGTGRTMIRGRLVEKQSEVCSRGESQQERSLEYELWPRLLRCRRRIPPVLSVGGMLPAHGCV